LTILQSDDLPHALFGMKLTDLVGINKRTEARLNAAGIFTVEQLCSTPRDRLRQGWGSVLGERWWFKLRGFELNESFEQGQSLGHSHVMAPELRNDEGTKQVLLRLLQKASARLRSNGLTARVMAVGVSGRQSWKAHCRMSPTADTVTLNEHFLSLWESRSFKSPIKASVTFTELEAAENVTPSLFDEAVQRAELSAAVDDLNHKFGKNTVYLAGMRDAKDAAPERIAFAKTELFVEGKGDHEWVDTFRGLVEAKPRARKSKNL
jgi:DNA polymerase-4